jgi:hypothetical protein
MLKTVADRSGARVQVSGFRACPPMQCGRIRDRGAAKTLPVFDGAINYVDLPFEIIFLITDIRPQTMPFSNK